MTVATDESGAGPGRGAGGMALAVLAICTAFNLIARGVADSFAVFLLPLSHAFGTERAALTGIYSIYMVAHGVAAPAVGMAFDRAGPRAVYAAGLLCLGLAYLLAGGAGSLWELYLLIGLGVGIGGAAIGMVPASALVSRWFDRRLPRAMSVLYAALGIGVLALAPTAQALIGWLGWRDAWRVIGIALLALLPLTQFLPWRRIAVGRPGYADETRRRAAAEGTWTLGRAMREPAFWGLFGVFLVTSVTTYTVSVQIVAYLVEAGFAPLTAASVYGLAGSLSVIGMMSAGLLAERYGERRVATASYCTTIAGIGALALLDVWPGYALLAAFVVLFGTVSGSRGPLVATLTARAFSGAGIGAIYGGITVGMGLGAALGSWAAGVLHDLTGGYQAGFALAASGAVAGIGLFRWMERREDARAGVAA